MSFPTARKAEDPPDGADLLEYEQPQVTITLACGGVAVSADAFKRNLDETSALMDSPEAVAHRQAKWDRDTQQLAAEGLDREHARIGMQGDVYVFDDPDQLPVRKIPAAEWNPNPLPPLRVSDVKSIRSAPVRTARSRSSRAPRRHVSRPVQRTRASPSRSPGSPESPGSCGDPEPPWRRRSYVVAGVALVAASLAVDVLEWWTA